MANRAEATITLTDTPHDDELAVIVEGLRAYNEAQAGYSDSRALAVLVRDPETKKVVGGLHGRTSLGLLRVERFFCRKICGAAGLAAEFSPWQRKKGGDAVVYPRGVVDSPTFRRPGFYLKQGWEVAARIECEPPGHIRFHMTKKLS